MQRCKVHIIFNLSNHGKKKDSLLHKPKRTLNKYDFKMLYGIIWKILENCNDKIQGLHICTLGVIETHCAFSAI